MSNISTYSSDDITSTGWRVNIGPKRTVATYRSRWQGSCNGIIITLYGDHRYLLRKEIYEIDDIFDDYYNRLIEMDGPVRGRTIKVNNNICRLTSNGYTVN